MTLDGGSFAEFFEVVYGQGRHPHPWQQRLADAAIGGEWPQSIRIPTGLGKTAALAVAVFAMAANPATPTRVAYCVDRRTVVDAAYEQALRIQRALEDALAGHEASDVVCEVARRLAERSGAIGDVRGLPPLLVSRLRGGAPRDDDWRLSPTTPAVLVATVDQFGSRLLHRGYGVSAGTRSLEAGLLGMDCLLLLDEPHLSVPLLQTATDIRRYQSELSPGVQPLQTVVLGATPPVDTALDAGSAVSLAPDDLESPFVRGLLAVRKPISIVKPTKGTITRLVREALRTDKAPGAHPADRIGVVVNTVGRARAVWKELRAANDLDIEVDLVVGRSRPVDRAEIEQRLLERCGPEADLSQRRSTPYVVVSTQTLEVGADLSFNHLISEAAPWPNLVQRAGRLLRRGPEPMGDGGTRDEAPFVVVATLDKHPAYQGATKETLDALRDWIAEDPDGAELGFHGIRAAEDAGRFDASCHPPQVDAPVLLDEHLRTWSLTKPSPEADIPVAPFLHGVSNRADDVRLVWRRGLAEAIDPERWEISAEEIGVDVLPVRPAEVLEVPVGVARAFLAGVDLPQDVLYDDITTDETVQIPLQGRRSHVFCVAPEPSAPARPSRQRSWSRRLSDVRPGRTVVVDSKAGGLLPTPPELFEDGEPRYLAWDPSQRAEVSDESAGVDGRDTVRVRLSALRGSGGETSRSITDMVPGLAIDEDRLAAAETALREAFRETLSVIDREIQYENAVEQVTSAIMVGGFSVSLAPGWLRDGVPRDWVVVIKRASDVESTSRPLSLAQHSAQVAALTSETSSRLPVDLRTDMVVAARHHDDGKRREEWQIAMGGSLDGGILLSKPARWMTQAETRQQLRAAGAEDGWRHEALSAALLEQDGATDLAIHLAGSHHGQGRPFYAQHLPSAPEQQLSGRRAERFASLVATHGYWGLAYMEAVLRLSDWAASAAPSSPRLRKIVHARSAAVATAQPPSPGMETSEAPRERVVLTGLSASNLADYCTAVGLLRALSQVDPGATLEWHIGALTPVLSVSPEALSPSLLDTALGALTTFRDRARELFGQDVTGGRSGIPVDDLRVLARRTQARSAETRAWPENARLDVELWLSGCHTELSRQSGDHTKVTASAAAIWTGGRASPWAQVSTACDDFASAAGTGRRSRDLRRTLDEINRALVESAIDLHLLREEQSKTYGIDYRSGSYRAKADRDSGYVPFLVGFTHYGFNAIYRPRSRNASINGRRERWGRPMVLDEWLHAEPLNFRSLLAVLAACRTAGWLGSGSRHLRTEQIKVSDQAVFYGAALPEAISEATG